MRVSEDRSDVKTIALAAVDDRLLHAFNGMLSEQLQDTNKLPRASLGTVLLFQRRAQIAEYCRQLPLSVHVGVIERRRFASERHQVMQGIKDLHTLCIGPQVLGDDLAAGHDIDVMHIGLDGHCLEGKATRHAVAISIEAHRLILVYLGRLPYRRIEWLLGERQGLGTFAFEALANGLLLACLRAVAITPTTGPENGVQFVEVFDLRHRCRPISLQELHATFDARLLLGPPHQAKQRLEIVMACQSKVTLVDLPAAALK